MKLIKFLQHRSKMGLYYNIQKFDGFLDNLACFFIDEIGGECESSWIAFLKNPKDFEMSGNEIRLEKEGKNVYLSNLYYAKSDTQKKLEVPIATLIEFIYIWEKLLDQQPDEIILTYENRQYELSGRNFSEQESRIAKSILPRMIHGSDDPDSWLEVDQAGYNIFVNEAYQNALHNGVTPLFFNDSQEYMICGYTKNGVRLQIIFDENNCIEDSFCIYLKKEKS